MPLTDVLAHPPPGLASTLIVTHIKLPTHAAHATFWSDRAAQRYYNSHAFVNLALSTVLEDAQVTAATLQVGFHGHHAWCCQRVPVDALLRRPLTRATVAAALRGLGSHMGTRGAGAYAVQAAQGMLLQALAPHLPEKLPDAGPLGPLDEVVARHTFPDYSHERPPVHCPVPKDRVLLQVQGESDHLVSPCVQASGEAAFAGDLPMPAGGLYAALVLSRQAAKRVSVDPSPALALAGTHGCGRGRCPVL